MKVTINSYALNSFLNGPAGVIRGWQVSEDEYFIVRFERRTTYKKNWKELQGEDGAIVCENLGTIGSYVLSNDLNTFSSSKETGLEEAGPLRVVIRPSSASPILTDADIAVFNSLSERVLNIVLVDDTVKALASSLVVFSSILNVTVTFQVPDGKSKEELCAEAAKQWIHSNIAANSDNFVQLSGRILKLCDSDSLSQPLGDNATAYTSIMDSLGNDVRRYWFSYHTTEQNDHFRRIQVINSVRVDFFQNRSANSSDLITPVIELHPLDKMATVCSNVQVLTYVGPIKTEPLSKSLSKHISNIKKNVLTFLNAAVRGIRLESRYYLANSLLVPDLVTCYYDSEALDENEATFVQLRKVYHQLLQLPMDRPMLRRSFGLPIFQTKIASSGKVKLQNVHTALKKPNSIKGSTHLIQGNYDYYHYMHDSFNDNGWGCAYRSMQTLCSWLLHAQYTSKLVPTHQEIQQMLVELGDKPANFYNSKQWIGAFEINLCLSAHYGTTCRILNVNSGSQIGTLATQLSRHFDENGSPVMIGGGVLAYTLLGIFIPSNVDDNGTGVQYLILDPHYTGEDNLQTIINKGWCSWKTIELFRPDSFYNMCLPLRPRTV